MLNPILDPDDQPNTVSLVATIADYAASFSVDSDSAITAARHCLIDAFGSGFAALRDPECASQIGPLVPGALMPGGARVPGTSLELDPAQAAFCTTLMLCHSRSPSQWLALRIGSTADSLGAILAAADYQGRKAIMEGKSPPKVRDVLAAIVKALEIQAVLIPDDPERQLGLGMAVRLARAGASAIVAAQLGGTLGQIVAALSYACIDSGLWIDDHERLRVRRCDWAMADGAARAVRHACQVMFGPPGYLTPIDLKAVDLAGAILGGNVSRDRKSFGTVIIDRLAAARRPHEVTELMARFLAAVDRYFPTRQAERIKALFAAPERLDDLPVNELLAALVTNGAR